MLLGVPGLAVANRNNPTQDPRISIRGFGSRSAFGVRGVRVLRDGIPLTLPDGQTPVDVLDLESVGRVEVIRGTSSSLYGNASGGVVDLRSEPPPVDALALELRGWGASQGTHRWTGSLGGSSGAVRYQGSVTHTDADGFRRYAAQRVLNASGRVQTTLGATALSLVAMGFDMPVAENPGALTREQLESDRRAADPLNIAKRARKDVSQWQGGLTATRALLGAGEVQGTVYGGTRSLSNPLSFSINDIDRTFYGASARATVPLSSGDRMDRLSVGVDVQRQDDDRVEYANCNVDGAPATVATATCPVANVERGTRRRDQRERVSSIGPFARAEVSVAPRVTAHAGLRADYVTYDVTDRLITASDPDDSGERTLSAWSPMVGLVGHVGPTTSVYASYSTAFETPTATELNNSEGVSGGINRELEPQRARTLEVGIKGAASSGVRYDAAVFQTRVRNELIPFEVANSSRRYFRNAGETTRRGAEAGIEVAAGPVWIGAAYSYSDFRFAEYSVDDVDYEGKRIPGVPVHQVQGSVTWRPARAFITTEVIGSSKVYVDDGNTATASGYATVNLRAGGTVAFGRQLVTPVVGVQNLFDREYVGSVSVNASGGKYYEPSPGRLIYAGLTVAVGR